MNEQSAKLAEPGQKLSRAERKRLKTREKIVSAAGELMRTRPLDELTISDITEAADVGHGTFYLHFKSKYEVVVPLFHQKTQLWDAAIQKAPGTQDDPAAAVARSTRYIGRMMAVDPLCRWFIQHSGFPVNDLRAALGPFVARDVERGLESGRFTVSDLEITAQYLFGGVVSAMMSIFDAEDPEDDIDRLAELMLRVLGVPTAEANELAHQPLPDIPAG